MSPLATRILALDPGEKRVGAALSDPTGTIASGLPTIPFTTLPALVDAVAGLCAVNEVGEVVVGHPLNMNGTEGPKAAEARLLADALRERLGIPVILVDERLTTVMSTRILMEGGMDGRKRRGMADQMAARLILETHLERRRRS
jgi:putative Holliday junction resolvase